MYSILNFIRVIPKLLDNSILNRLQIYGFKNNFKIILEILKNLKKFIFYIYFKL